MKKQLFNTVKNIGFLCGLISSIITYGQTIQEHSFDLGPDSLIYIDSSDFDNIWIIGEPDKYFFTSGHASGRAIFTDSLYYPVSDTSDFFVNYTGHNIYYSIYLSFYYKIDTDTLSDFGSIYIFDGIKWTDLLKEYKDLGSFYIYKDGTSELIYSSHTNDSIVINPFTGHSDGWYLFNYRLTAEIRQWPGNVVFKFVFESDSNNSSKEGWLIDNIVLCDMFDFGISTQEMRLYRIYPNPVCEKLVILSNSDFGENSIEVFSPCGSLVCEESFYRSFELDCSRLRGGVYYLKITNSINKPFIDKFIKL